MPWLPVGHTISSGMFAVMARRVLYEILEWNIGMDMTLAKHNCSHSIIDRLHMSSVVFAWNVVEWLE